MGVEAKMATLGVPKMAPKKAAPPKMVAIKATPVAKKAPAKPTVTVQSLQ